MKEKDVRRRKRERQREKKEFIKKKDKYKMTIGSDWFVFEQVNMKLTSS